MSDNFQTGEHEAHPANEYQPPPPHHSHRPHPHAPLPKKRKGCAFWAVVILGIGCLLFAGLLLLGFVGMALEEQGFDVANAGHASSLIEQTVVGDGENKVLMIPISGIIADGSQGIAGGNGVVSETRAMLARARQDADIQAILLTINSPGGGITASDVLYHELDRFRMETGMPVVAIFGDVAASGGYYVAAAAEHITAHPTSVTGSIGVIMPLIGYKGLMQKLGLESRPIKSGKNKDLASGSRDITAEEKEMLQTIVDEYHQRFVSVVHSGFQLRDSTLSREEIAKSCDGRVFTGSQAKELGFVDDIGYFEDAVAEAYRRANITPGTGRVITYAPKPTIMDLIFAKASAPQANTVKLEIDGITNLPTQQFMYLWKVGAGE